MTLLLAIKSMYNLQPSNKLFTAIWIFFIAVFSFLMVKITYPYFSFRYDTGFLLTKQSVIHISIWRLAFYTHISSSLIVLMLGAFQFNAYIQKNKADLHRFLGKMYVYLVLFVSAPSGLVMAYYANGGFWAKLSFVLTSLLWWFFTFNTVKYAVSKQFIPHQKHAIRSYALTLSAITLRTYALTFPMFFHLHAKEMYTLIAWLSWIPNLLIAELIIISISKKKPKSNPL